MWGAAGVREGSFYVVLAQVLGAHDSLQAEGQKVRRNRRVLVLDQRLAHLADGGQLDEQHLEDGGRQRLLQHLQQLLRLSTHSDGVGQVVYAVLVIA